MLYHDELYGEVDISEPLLLELMASRAMQRLKGVFQHGVTALLGITPAFSRFDHCVGAMILVRRLGANIDEQAAALLHDISHTAFSHVVDFVFDDHSGQSYHEEMKESVVADSDIPAIMEHHGRDWRDFMDEAYFTLLEQPAPALCADRLDYFLRDLACLRLAARHDMQVVLEALVVNEGRIVVNNIDTARWLAYTFIEADRASWSHFREVGLYQVTAEAIKAANQLGFIVESDLWGTDEALWHKLRSAEHAEVRGWVKLITPGTRFIWDEQKPQFRVTTKIRTLDPLVVHENQVTPLSALDVTFAQYREAYLSGKQGLWPMGISRAPASC